MVDEEFKAVPSITVDQEDIAYRQGRRSVPPRNIEEQTGTAELASSARASGPAALGLNRIVVGFGVAILAALAGIIWLYLQLQQSTEQLAMAAIRIDQLESRLASTDTTITKSEILLADKLKSMDQLIDTNKSEIRKLWGLAGDTQRKAIEQLKVTNEQQNATLKSLQEHLANSEQKIGDQQTALNQLAITTKNSEASAREAVQRMELVQEKMSAVDSEFKSIKQKQSQQEGDYGKRIATLEDTAKSTDVFRRNTQEDLRKLKEELLRQSAPSSKSSL